jgi:hypothetical protein
MDSEARIGGAEYRIGEEGHAGSLRGALVPPELWQDGGGGEIDKFVGVEEQLWLAVRSRC